MANVIAENVGVLASSRTIVLLDQLDLEEAWNFGFNFTQNFKLGEKEGSFSADIYRTNFVNQVVMDLNSDVNLIQFYNLNGESYANSFLGSTISTMIKQTEIIAHKPQLILMQLDKSRSLQVSLLPTIDLIGLDWVKTT